MLVKLKRPLFTKVGLFKPDPDGVLMPDSLYELVLATDGTEVLEEPDEVNAVPDPVAKPTNNSFIKAMEKKPEKKRRAKPKSAPAEPVLDLNAE